MTQLRFGKSIQVTDPCYDPDTWCAYTLKNMRKGNYVTTKELSDEGNWGMRVKSLSIVHEDFKGKDLTYTIVKEAHIGVDSGQAGFFDRRYFNNVNKTKEVKDVFYDECCNITLNDDANSVLSSGKGVVSSSGYGDGGYNLYVAKDTLLDEIVAAKIVFIGEDDDEETDEDEDEGF